MEARQYYEYYGAILKILNDSQREMTRKDIYKLLITEMELTEEELTTRLETGQLQSINRFDWAMTYLKKSGNVKSPSKSTYLITPMGQELYARKGKNIGITDINDLPEDDNKSISNQYVNNSVEKDKLNDKITPTENILSSIETINEEITAELLELIIRHSLVFFEKLVLDVLISLGYGGKVEINPMTSDEFDDTGIEGIIKEDELGLNKIYIQAKKHNLEDRIDSSDIRNFIGSLSLKNADKGIFITTSGYTDEAIDDADNSYKSIVLIDGLQLCKYMIERQVGVSCEQTFFVSKIDTDYFLEE